MECTIREFDLTLIRGLRSTDIAVHERCVRRVFYEDLETLLRSIQCSLFKGSIEYDDLVNELYLFLSRNNWKILDSFQGRGGARLSTWLSHVVWRYFMHAYKRESRMIYQEDHSKMDKQVYAISADEMRIDIEKTLSQMENKRYVLVIRLLIIEGHKAEDVAAMMNTTIQNIYNLKHRAIGQFLKIYNS
ncbi:MAG: sigma-70 family RNA polymerase sigma factor [Bacteroidales bacterium]|nr:sigma-70 family RNA polymerase sigma factor [Bacteroidales bacterium]